MAWTDQLDDYQRAEIALARHYAKQPYGTDGHHRLLLIAKLAELLDVAVANAALARIAAMDDRPPLQQVLARARNAGAAAWVLRGAEQAGLVYTGDGQQILHLEPPHEIVVLISIPRGDGGEAGIEFHGPGEM